MLTQWVYIHYKYLLQTANFTSKTLLHSFMIYGVLKQLSFTCFYQTVMRNFWVPLNFNLWKVIKENTCAGVSFIINLPPGDLQLYLNKTHAEVHLWILFSFTEHQFAENLWNVVSVAFSQVLLFPVWKVVRQWRPEIQNVKVNQFKNNTAKFHVMWRVIYLYKETALGLLFSKI